MAGDLLDAKAIEIAQHHHLATALRQGAESLEQDLEALLAFERLDDPAAMAGNALERPD